MKRILYILLIIGLSGCAARYEVVQKLEVNMYHLINIKTKEVDVIFTSDTLEIGQILKKNKIRIVVELQK
jgi:hypothetical protein